jgi:hypothetical protein
MQGIRAILIFSGILSAGGRPCGALLYMPIERCGHSSGVGVEQQIQDGAGELTFLWTETEQPAALK